MMLLLLKAQVRHAGHHDLFATPTQVKGHVQAGHVIAPYTAMRKKAAPELRQTALLFTAHAPMQQTVVVLPQPAAPVESKPVVMLKPPVDDAKRKAQAAKLREAGESIIAAGDESLGRDRQANTRRRVQQASSAIETAQRETRIGKTMVNLADAIERGDAVSLAGITSRTGVEALEELLSGARVRHRQIKSNGDSRQRQNDWDEMHRRPVEPDDIAHAILPSPQLHGHQAKDLIEAADVLGVVGHRSIREALRRMSGYDDAMRPTPEQQVQLKELAAAIEPKARAHVDDYKLHYTLRNAARQGRWAIKTVRDLITRQNRYAKLGLHSDKDVQNALTAFVAYRGGSTAENPIKKLERELVGTKPGVDFFPTPPPLAARMVALAGISPGTRVLEPSAGKGDIADQIKEAGGTVEAVEQSETLRKIIEAKGHALVARDFMDYRPDEPYDSIVMNPPWSGGADVRHVMHAYSMLKPGGRMVALISNHASFAQDKQSVAFRAFMDEHGQGDEKLPASDFHSQWMPGGIPSWLISITKPGAD